MTKFSKLKIIILFSIFCFLFSLSAIAAKLELNSSVSEIGTGQQFKIDLTLDAEGEDINAAEGLISFPAEMLELKEIRDGESVVSFWIEKPSLKEAGKIKFSGVIPGGFRGILGPYWKGYQPGKVLSLIFNAKKEGMGAVKIRDAKVLLNDGKGTPAGVQISNFQFLISNQIPSSKFQTPSFKDSEPPELFTPEIARDPNIFGGKWFLVFAAQDKGLGIDYYEIAEKRGSNITQNYAELLWQKEESPYLLEDQKLKSYIYVRAVDKAGNARIVYLPPQAPWYKKWPVYILVGLGLAIVVLLIKWLWRKLKSRD